ncbi:hypothetical protein KQI63_11230 [bacterium]|nr:hypothetical protein [bacterium]
MRLPLLTWLTLFILLPFSLSIAGVPARYGGPLYNTYEPEDYHGEGQNFDLAVNSKNIIYVANAVGVLEFDGTRWRTIESTTHSIPFGLDCDEQDNIWVAMQQDLGVLFPDSSGTLTFHSLLPQITDSLDIASGVWRVRATTQGIFFQSPKFVLRWRVTGGSPLEGEAKIFHADGHSFTLVCEVDSTIFIRQHRSPISRLEGDSIVPVSQWSDHARISYVHATRFDEDHVLFTTFRGRLYVGGPDGIDELKIQVPEDFDMSVCFGSIPLSDDRFVISTNQGMVVIDRAGKVKEVVDKLGGLSTRNILREATIDHSGGYWFPFDYGLARVEFDRSMRILDRGSGIGGAIFEILRFNNNLYMATGTGLYVHPEKDSLSVPKLTNVDGMQLAIHHTAQTDEQLFLATVRGLHYMGKDNKVHHLGPFIGNCVGITVSEDQKNLYLGSELQGLYHFRLKDGAVLPSGRLDLPQTGFDRITFDSAGNLWAMVTGANQEKLHRSTLDLNNPTQLEFFSYGSDKGLPGTTIGTPFMLEDSLRVLTTEGYFTYNPELDHFLPTLRPFPVDLSNTFLMEKPLVDESNRIYLSAGPNTTVRVSLDQDSERPVDRLLQRSPILRVLAFFHDPVSNLTIFGTDDGQMVFSGEEEETTKPVVLLREAIIGDESIHIRSGKKKQYRSSVYQGPLASVRFVYTMTSFDAPEMSQFQYRLVGRGDEWSAWSNETYRDFNDLREGAYQFEVRGRDYSRIISDPAIYSFTVLPPWYRTSWMLVIWTLLAGGLIYLLIQVRTRQLAAQQLRLEALVRKRTEELKQAQEAEIREIEARKAAELESNRLKTVAQLATTVAHELNNPLAVIQGRVEVADMDKQLNPELRQVHDSIRDQVSRMSKLVDKLTGIESIRVVDYAGGIKMLDLKPPPQPGSTDQPPKDTPYSDSPEKE